MHFYTNQSATGLVARRSVSILELTGICAFKKTITQSTFPNLHK